MVGKRCKDLLEVSMQVSGCLLEPSRTFLEINLSHRLDMIPQSEKHSFIFYLDLTSESFCEECK